MAVHSYQYPVPILIVLASLGCDGEAPPDSGPPKMVLEVYVLLSALSFFRADVSWLVAQEAFPVVGRSRDRTGIVRTSLNSRVVSEVYRSAGYVDQLRLGPQGQYVALTESVPVGTGARQRRLVVVDLKDGSVRVPQEDRVFRYEWCCDGITLAVISAHEVDGDFVSDSLSLVNALTGTRTRISGLRWPYDVAWADFDSSLYILTPGEERLGVYRYHPRTARLSITPHRGIHFSPDGQYYYFRPFDGPPGLRLYRTSDYAEITGQVQVSDEHLRFGLEGTWLPGANHVLVVIERNLPEGWPLHEVPRRKPKLRRVWSEPGYSERWKLLIDVATGRVIGRFQGGIMEGWQTVAPVLPVVRHGTVQAIRPPRGYEFRPHEKE